MPARSVVIVPAVGVSVTASDNSNLSATDRRSEIIVQATPSLRAQLRSGRVEGFLDYTLTGSMYSAHSESNQARHTLAARGSAELIDNRFFLNTRASMSRRAISAFGTQEANSGLANSNATDVASVGITPTLRGRLGSSAGYDVRLDRELTRSKDSLLNDNSATSASARISGGAGLYGWSLDGIHSVNDYRGGRRTTNDRVFLGARVTPDPEVQFSLRAGRESDTVLSADRRYSTTYGGAVNWQPTPRTSVSLDADHRYYGNSYNLVFQHRMARSLWRYGDSRSASTSSTPTPVTVYDLYFAQFAAQVPDPVERDLFVRQYLQLLGINPSAGVGGGFLTSSLTLSHRRDAALTIQDVRTTYTLLAFSNDTRRLDSTNAPLADDLTRVDRVRQVGYSLSVGHRLTPDSSLSLSTSRLKTLGSDTLRGNDLRSLDVAWSGRFGPHVGVSLGGRHSEADSALNPYTESALTATLSLKF